MLIWIYYWQDCVSQTKGNDIKSEILESNLFVLENSEDWFIAPTLYSNLGTEQYILLLELQWDKA